MQDFKDEYYSFQEGAKRFNGAMKGIPDRVLVYAQKHDFAMNELGIQANTSYTTPRNLHPRRKMSPRLSNRYMIMAATIIIGQQSSLLQQLNRKRGNYSEKGRDSLMAKPPTIRTALLQLKVKNLFLAMVITDCIISKSLAIAPIPA